MAAAGTRDADRLDVLVQLVHAYEEQHHPVLPPHPIEAIRFRLQQMGLGSGALRDAIGHRG